MASKRRNMFYENKKQETTEIEHRGDCGQLQLCSTFPIVEMAEARGEGGGSRLIEPMVEWPRTPPAVYQRQSGVLVDYPWNAVFGARRVAQRERERESKPQRRQSERERRNQAVGVEAPPN
ncbi:hypothetical protein AAG570_000345 [Ranatra chinensis]|uniref:Uncharacterized protein n=1 Tax=Ranatra chinensis TaxID=642074 RepID=A0ABD0ZDP5_9HEMI